MRRIVWCGLAAVALAGCSHTQDTGSTGTLGSVLARAGFDELALASTAYGPGSLVTSVKGSQFQAPLRLAYICDPTYTASFPPLVDAAASQQISSSLGGGLELSGGALQLLGLGASAEYLESVTLHFTNVKVEQLPHENLDAVVRGLGPECTEILNRFKAQGIARQTQQAIRADVEYRATFKRGVSAEARRLVIGSMIAGFGGSVESESDTAVTGEGLYYGVILREV
jgi:hypothetical protein